MLKVVDKLLKKLIIILNILILGGGMGIDYDQIIQNLIYKNIMLNKKFLKNNNSKIIFEPGRSIIGNTAVLITKLFI